MKIKITTVKCGCAHMLYHTFKRLWSRGSVSCGRKSFYPFSGAGGNATVLVWTEKKCIFKFILISMDGYSVTGNQDTFCKNYSPTTCMYFPWNFRAMLYFQLFTVTYYIYVFSWQLCITSVCTSMITSIFLIFFKTLQFFKRPTFSPPETLDHFRNSGLDVEVICKMYDVITTLLYQH